MKTVIWKDENIKIEYGGMTATGKVYLTYNGKDFFAEYDFEAIGKEFRGLYPLKGNEKVSGSYLFFKYEASVSNWTLTNTEIEFNVQLKVKAFSWKTLYQKDIKAKLPDEKAFVKECLTVHSKAVENEKAVKV